MLLTRVEGPAAFCPPMSRCWRPSSDFHVDGQCKFLLRGLLSPFTQSRASRQSTYVRFLLVASLLSAEKFQLGANKSPRVPCFAFYSVPKQVNCGGVVVIETPIPDAITHRIEGEFSFEIFRSRRRGRQN